MDMDMALVRRQAVTRTTRELGETKVMALAIA